MSELHQPAAEDEHRADTVSSAEPSEKYSYCALPAVPEPVFDRNVNPMRMELIRVNDGKQVNGTVLHYFFFDTNEEQKNVVREAFDAWKNLGIGLKFKEVDSPAEAEIKIGFVRGDRAWSFVERDVIELAPGAHERTMNFGWDLTGDPRDRHGGARDRAHTRITARAPES